MKKLVIAALAIASLAACTKSNVQYEQPGEISLQPVAQKATKAAYTENTYGADAPEFKVWAWWTNVGPETPVDEFKGQTTIHKYIDLGKFVHKESGSWGGAITYYWPTEGSLVFAGYSPATASATKFDYDLSEKTFKVQEFQQSEEIANTVDLMWFDVTEKSYNNNANKNKQDQNVNGVPVVFHHALSWLTFKLKLKDNATEPHWKIKEISLTGIETKATFSATVGSDPNWTTYDNEKIVKVYDGVPKLIEDSEDGTVLENKENGVVVIPQSCKPEHAKLVIKYDLKNPASLPEFIEDQTVSLDLNADFNNWMPGYHYTYTITFGANEIRIVPEVGKWINASEVQVPVE